MTYTDSVLLYILKRALLAETKGEEISFSAEDWDILFQRAYDHEILPLIVDSCIHFKSVRDLEKNNTDGWRKKALSAATRQIVQTNEFLTLLLHARQQNLSPAVLKGIVCRSLYPQPCLRPSVDEDLLISPDDTEQWHRFLLSEGLIADDPDLTAEQRKKADELSYHKVNSPTYIELHKSLFSSDSEAYGELNGLFEGVRDRTVTIQVEDVSVRTLSPTDHLLFMICHAYKHFLHSGVGIRQIADIAMFGNAYWGEIDWKHIYESCHMAHIEVFTAALLKIAHEHLTLPSIPETFSDISVNEEPLLEDILSGGLYGTSDINRVHSANMTLEAVAASRQGRRSSGLLRSLFPGKSYFQRQFSYAKKYPVLLPAAWAHRIIRYLLRKGKGAEKEQSNLSQSIQIGRDRIELLKKYNIIE